MAMRTHFPIIFLITAPRRWLSAAKPRILRGISTALTALISMTMLSSTSLAATTTSPAPARESARQHYSDRYAVLAERNIFLRDRARPTTQPRPAEPARRSPEQSFVLTGIVAEEDGIIRAYFEDVEGEGVTRIAIGDAIARGRVSAILIDAIEYESNGQRTWVEIGSDLTGRAAAVASSGSSDDEPTTAPADAAASIDPNDPNLTMEQRLRLRRLQELNRR